MSIKLRLGEYEQSLDNAIKWLIASINKNSKGSRAYFSLAGFWWQKSYPETTGYIIPTLIEYSKFKNKKKYFNQAKALGNWLLSIQDERGYWLGGFYPNKKKDNYSVFNTGQILIGMMALYKETSDKQWIEAAEKGTAWLAKSLGNKLWERGNYKNFSPAYYSRVAWPMLSVAEITNNSLIKKQAIKALDQILLYQNKNGSFEKWGFEENDPAFTHTIAYTVRGFIESSAVLENWERYGKRVEITLNKFYRLTELNNGRLGGAYDNRFNAVNHYTCPTGNAQLAICLMRWHQQQNDLRLLNAASKLVNNVKNAQFKMTLSKNLKGGIPGSKPLWGRYMILRMPNWAAKFYADSVMLLIKLIKREENSWNIRE